MKLERTTRRIRGRLVVLLGWVLLTACATTICLKGFGCIETVEVTIEEGVLTLDDSPDGEPVQICFFDEDGNPVPGGGVLRPGESMPIPPGATSATAKRVQDDDGTGRSGPRGPAHAKRLVAWRLFGFPVVPDLSRGVLDYDVTVWARTRAEAEATAEELLELVRSGVGTPAGVYEIRHAAHAILRGTDVQFRFAEDRPLSRLDVSLDGVLVSTLSEMSLRSAHGLHVATFQLPYDVFQAGTVSGLTYRTELSYRIENDEDPRSEVGRRIEFEYTP